MRTAAGQLGSKQYSGCRRLRTSWLSGHAGGRQPTSAEIIVDNGVCGMARMCDARMSGTAYETCILHIAPEAVTGGPLVLVENAYTATLVVLDCRIDHEVDAGELKRRADSWSPLHSTVKRRWTSLYVQSTSQADERVDLGMLAGSSGDATPRRAFSLP